VGEVEQVRPLGVVELQGSGEGVEDGGGHPGDRAAFQLRVVLDAHPGEGGDFTAAQPGHAAVADVGQPRLLRGDLGPAGDEEVADLGAIVHVIDGTAGGPVLGCPVSTRLARDSPPAAGSGLLVLSPSTARREQGGVESAVHRKVHATMNPTYDFTGQVAFVTGASSGMGLATARAFAQAGAAVALADINDTALQAATESLRAAGHRVLGVRCDVADEAGVAAAVRATVERFGRLDMAFNNAGIQVPPSDAADEPVEVFDRVNAINLRGVWACMKHELAQMRSQGSGAIVNCSSLGGLVGLPGRAAYHASKHGVLGLTSSAALEYAPRGIRINAICPGTIATPMVTDMIDKGELDLDAAVANQPINRLGEPDEIAAAVLWLCSPGASFVIGVALPVDGGYTAQ
jgi:NAD(P)-dependent dehydrogenase (short-subunit alcohol dehydrogenase family)